MVTKYSLNEAQAAVRRAVQQIAHDFDPVISEAEAAGLDREVNAFTDTFDLDEWVFASPLLKKWFCRFPLCFNPPRPPGQADDGSRKGGNHPAYCADGVDEAGKSHNDPKYAGRRREALRKDRGARAAGQEPGHPEDRPVSQARATIATQVAEVLRRFEELTGQVRDLTELAERAGDADFRYGEIQAVELQAQEGIARETRLRLEAEKAQRAGAQDVNRMASELEEATDITRQLTDELTTERDAREQAEQAAEITRRDAERQIVEVEEQCDRELRERAAEMATVVSAATSERDKAKADATQLAREAAAEIAAAHQAATDALADRASAQAEVNSLRAENTGLRDAAISREREFEKALAEHRKAQQREETALRATIEQLHGTIERLHDQADQVRNAHDKAITDLRVTHEQHLATKLAEAAATTARVHQAEIAALTAQLEMLRVRLDEQPH